MDEIGELIRLQNLMEGAMKNDRREKLPEEYKTYMDLVQDLEPEIEKLAEVFQEGFKSTEKLMEDLRKDRELVEQMAKQNRQRPEIPEDVEELSIDTS
jgi:hypothetical protein